MTERYYLKQNFAFEMSEEGELGLRWGDSHVRLKTGANCPALEVAAFCMMRLSGRGGGVYMWDESNPSMSVRMYAVAGRGSSAAAVEARRGEQVQRMVLGALGVANLLDVLLSNIVLPDVVAMESGIIVRWGDHGAEVDVKGHVVGWSHEVLQRVRRALILALESSPSPKKAKNDEKGDGPVFRINIPEAELSLTRKTVLGTDTFFLGIHQQYFRPTGIDLARLLAFLSRQPKRKGALMSLLRRSSL